MGAQCRWAFRGDVVLVLSFVQTVASTQLVEWRALVAVETKCWHVVISEMGSFANSVLEY